MDELEKNIKLALNWLLYSGIQKMDGEAKGGFAAWYDVERNEFSFIYSEITGYALNLLLSYEKLYDSDDIRYSIQQATDYLTSRAFDNKFEAVKCRYIPTKGWLEYYCTFDNIIIANSLINKYRFDKDLVALEKAEQILNTLMTKLFYGDGFYARYIAPEKKFQNDYIKWSTCSGPHHAKMALPFLNMYDFTKEKKYLNFVIKYLNQLSNSQLSNGRFYTSHKDTFLHPHAYTLEGYLAAGLYLNNEHYLIVAQKGADWMKTLLLENYGIAGYIANNTPILLDSPDIDSQFLRILLLLNDSSLSENVSKLLKRILSFQKIQSNNIRIKGGFKIGDIWFYDQIRKTMLPIKDHINTWATIFALNAIYYYLKDPQDSALKRPFDLC